MKNNVFWGVIGAILVVWAATFWWLGWSTKSLSDAKNEGLTSAVRTLERLSTKSVEEFPTEELQELREAEVQRVQKSYEDSVAYLVDRDKMFERFLTENQSPTLVEWEARYKDAFRQLGEEYRAFAGLAGDAKLPFPEDTGIQNQASLPEYQKRSWSLEAIVRAVMQFPGSAIENLEFEDKPKDLGRLERSDYHDRKQWKLDVVMDPAKVPVMVTNLLAHEFVTFEVHRLIVTKSQQFLKANVVETRDQGAPVAGEPPVRVRLILNALDWKYAPPKSPE